MNTIKHQFNAAPLPMVWLLNGFAVSEGLHGKQVRYEHLPALLAALRAAVILKPGLLDRNEIAYLRRGLDLAQDDLAEILGVSGQTLSLWERASHSITRSADTVLRQLCVDKASAEVRQRLRGIKVEHLARLSRTLFPAMYEGLLTGGKWAFRCEPLPIAGAIQTVHVKTQDLGLIVLVPNVASQAVVAATASVLGSLGENLVPRGRGAAYEQIIWRSNA